jgi:hypothetical protein
MGRGGILAASGVSWYTESKQDTEENTAEYRMGERMTDQGLEGNEKIEEHIGMLQREPSPEMLAVTLSTIRRRMKQGGQFVVAVSPEKTQKLELRILEHEGKRWLEAYTSFEEEMKGAQPVMSTFLSDIGQVLRMALQSDEVEGLALNPYHRAILLDKHLIRLILGET